MERPRLRIYRLITQPTFQLFCTAQNPVSIHLVIVFRIRNFIYSELFNKLTRDRALLPVYRAKLNLMERERMKRI